MVVTTVLTLSLCGLRNLPGDLLFGAAHAPHFWGRRAGVLLLLSAHGCGRFGPRDWKPAKPFASGFPSAAAAASHSLAQTMTGWATHGTVFWANQSDENWGLRLLNVWLIKPNRNARVCGGKDRKMFYRLRRVCVVSENAFRRFCFVLFFFRKYYSILYDTIIFSRTRLGGNWIAEVCDGTGTWNETHRGRGGRPTFE